MGSLILKKILICVTLMITSLMHALPERPTMYKATFDDNGTRYTCVQEKSNDYNWLLFPGGPGADSSYFLPLVKSINLPGSVWLVDFPGNGDNALEKESFDSWPLFMIDSVKQFANPIVVGHSFGGKIALQCPELDSLIRGLIIIASAPADNPTENKKVITRRQLTTSPQASEQFKKHPCDDCFKKALCAGAARHFPEVSLGHGIEMFKKLLFNHKAVLWLVKKMQTSKYSATWIPTKIPTLIMGGSEDAIDPIGIFTNDERFKQNNIAIHVLEGAGHFPWFEQLIGIKKLFQNFVKTLSL